MNRPVEYLDLDDLADLARNLLGDPPPIRDIGLLGSAAARPQATAFGQDAYPDLITKAAALLQSIVNSHAMGRVEQRRVLWRGRFDERPRHLGIAQLE